MGQLLVLSKPNHTFVEAKPKPPCSPELDRYSLMSRCQLARVTNQVRRDSGYGQRPCHSARMSRSSGSATVWRDRELRGATTMASATALKSRTRKPFSKQLHSEKPKSIDPTSILAHILVWAHTESTACGHTLEGPAGSPSRLTCGSRGGGSHAPHPSRPRSPQTPSCQKSPLSSTAHSQ